MENKYWGDTTGSPSVLTMLILINQMEILCKEELFTLPHMSFIYFFFIYLFIFGWAGSSLLRLFSSCCEKGLLSDCDALASN